MLCTPHDALAISVGNMKYLAPRVIDRTAHCISLDLLMNSAICSNCYCSTHKSQWLLCYPLHMHCFPVVASRVVEPAPEQFVSLTLDGQLTIDPVVVDLQMAFNIFIIVSCLCHICKRVITLYTSCQAGGLSILDAKEFCSQFPFIRQWGCTYVGE